MSFLVLLDASPLGMVTNPRETDKTRACRDWLENLLEADVLVKVPEGADYEVRRELLRSGRTKGVGRLDVLAEQIGYFPITTDVLREASAIWAAMQQAGTPTADIKALDFDIILGAQARIAESHGYIPVIATSNVGHLARFSDAREWNRVGTKPLDPEAVQGLQFYGGATLERIINQDVDVFVKTSNDVMESAEMCRTFIKDGKLWLDLIPALNRKYIVPIPPDALIGKNEIEISVGRFGVMLDGGTQAGYMLTSLLEAKRRRS